MDPSKFFFAATVSIFTLLVFVLAGALLSAGITWFLWRRYYNQHPIVQSLPALPEASSAAILLSEQPGVSVIQAAVIQHTDLKPIPRCEYYSTHEQPMMKLTQFSSSKGSFWAYVALDELERIKLNDLLYVCTTRVIFAGHTLLFANIVREVVQMPVL